MIDVRDEKRNQILEGLNDQQKKAVTAMDGKYLVLAGSGSGKTLSGIRRIQYLLHMGVKPWEVVFFSFTKKSALEIQDRLTSAVGEIALDVNTGTFHSICMRILLTHQQAIGMHNITVMDNDESSQVIGELATVYGYSEKEGAKEMKHMIDLWGNEGLSPEDIKALNKYPEDIIGVYEEYTNYKRSVGYVDFNDILSLTHHLFNVRPDILEEYSRKYKYIILDEFQDTNKVQYRILEQLSSYHGNYMLLGDDFQTIFSFRGSDVQNTINLRQQASDIETILLEQNYRSTNNIVQASNAVIENNKIQMEKTSFTTNPDGAPVFLYDASDEVREAEFIATVINGLVKENNYEYDDFMVLYRSHYLSRPIEFAFNRLSIPYDVVGGTEFYERAEIKTLVAYLRVLDNKLDDLAFERIINIPKRQIGPTTIARIKMFATEAEIPFMKALENIEDIPRINNPTKKRIKKFLDMIKEGQAIVRKEEGSIQEAFMYILKETKFLDQYDKQKTKDIERIENIQELWNVIVQFDKSEKEELLEGQNRMNQFLTETALFIPSEEEDRLPRVRLLTAHSSKGLEEKVVFVVGLESGTFPSYLSVTEEEMEEERRLFYVSMTRAEEMLFLSHSMQKYKRGQKIYQNPSPFLNEIPECYIRRLGEKNE